MARTTETLEVYKPELDRMAEQVREWKQAVVRHEVHQRLVRVGWRRGLMVGVAVGFGVGVAVPFFVPMLFH